MDLVSNAFAVLELDAEDDHVNSSDSSSVPQSESTDNNTGNCKKKSNGTSTVEEENEKSVIPSVEYKMPLVWIDLEMTGLNVEVDRILEIACIITDGNLAKSVEGPDLVIHQSKECLENMGEWCQTHHAASDEEKSSGGLKELQEKFKGQLMGLAKFGHTLISFLVIEFVQRHVGSYKPLLAGNSVYMDFIFLKKYMPKLAAIFSHVVVDVSSVKALCIRWYPKDNQKAPSKENKHRAMDDIRESIKELKYFKQHIFKPKSKK